MTHITITIDSTNPDLIAKVREGLVQWNEHLGLDMDAAGAFHDLALYATSDQPGEDGVVYGTVFEGEANGAGTEVSGLWLRGNEGGNYTVLDTGGNDVLGFRNDISRIDGHDLHGVTLHDCRACQAGEHTLHAYEREN